MPQLSHGRNRREHPVREYGVPPWQILCSQANRVLKFLPAVIPIRLDGKSYRRRSGTNEAGVEVLEGNADVDGSPASAGKWRAPYRGGRRSPLTTATTAGVSSTAAANSTATARE